MQVFTDILGPADAPTLAPRLHALEHAQAVDCLRLARADLARRRLRARTEAGVEVAIALPRSLHLYDGAVLHLGAAAALVVRVEAEAWLRLCPADTAAALRLGYHAGNLHWRVRFEGAEMLVAIEGAEPSYRERLVGLVEEGAVRILGREEGGR